MADYGHLEANGDLDKSFEINFYPLDAKPFRKLEIAAVRGTVAARALFDTLVRLYRITGTQGTVKLERFEDADKSEIVNLGGLPREFKRGMQWAVYEEEMT